MSTIQPAVMSPFAEWDVIGSAELEKPKEYLEFNTPPLGLVIAMRNAGKAGYDIHEALVGVGKHRRVDASQAVTIKDQEQAATIYDYFAKKHTMRRLKNKYISQFMLAVDELCENRKRVDVEHAKILVSLPRIYEQNCSLERIMKSHVSCNKSPNAGFTLDETVEFVDSVNITMRGKTGTHQFWKTSQNHLIRILLKDTEYGHAAWTTFSKLGKIHLYAEHCYAYPIKGYDFKIIQPATSGMEINIA